MIDKNNYKTILFVETGTTGGGSFKSLTEFVQQIDLEKYRPVIICYNKTSFNKTWDKLGIKNYILYDHIYSVKSKSLISSFIKLIRKTVFRFFYFCPILLTKIFYYRNIAKVVKIINHENIDIVHLNGNIERDLFGVIAGKKCGKKCVSHLRSMRSKNFNNAMSGYANCNVDVFVANSKACKEYWTKKGVLEEKIRVIYNAIGVNNEEKIDIRKKYNISNSFKYVLGCVANFSEAKGHDFLIDVFKTLNKRNSNNYFLVLVGDGALRVNIQKKVRDLGLGKSVLFLGYNKKPRAIIKAFDVLLVPSKNEAFGRTVLEGMIERIPIIGTRVGGIPEIIEDKITGLLVDYGNVEQFVKHIEELLSNNKIRENIIEFAYRYVKNNFSMDFYSSQIESIY